MSEGGRKVVLPGYSGFYSGAQVYNGVVYCSGAVGIIPGQKGADGKPVLVDGGVKEQTHQALQNLEAVLKEAGSGLPGVLKLTAYLDSMDLYDAFNEVYLKFFPDVATRPARVCFAAAKLPFGALVEVEATAVADLGKL